jgi:tetratricopeptide (TPR) repeat protein
MRTIWLRNTALLSPILLLSGGAALAAPEVDPFAGRTVVLNAQELRGLPGEVAALLMRAEPGGDLTFEVNAVALGGSGERTLVPIFVEIDGAALLDRGQGVLGRVEVYAYAIDPAGKIGDFLVQAFTLDAEKLGEVLWQSGPRFQGNLQLRPGDYRLRVLVRESQSKAAGLRELPLHVAAPAATGTASAGEVGPPLFEEPRKRDSWIPVRAATPPAEGLLEESVAELEARWQRGSTAYPLVAGGRAMIPAALPVLGSGSPLRLYLPAASLPAGPGKAELLQNGKVLATVALSPAEDEVAESGADGSLRAFTLTPPALPPGRYSLKVTVGGSASPIRDVLIVAAEARDGELLWSDLRWRLKDAVPDAEKMASILPTPPPAPGKRPAAADEPKAADLRVKVGAVADRYRELMRKVPGQARTVNVAQLLEIEAQILESNAEEAMTILQNAELRVVNDLASWDAEALLPVIQLHYESYLAYRQRRIFALLTHSRILIERIVGVYVEKGKSEGTKRMGAQVLAGMGLEAEEGNLAASSRRFYQRALELDPANRQALLGLATAEERQSHRDQALELFRRLVSSHPDFAEGVLRLGVNERYANRDPRATLAKAKSLPGPSWIGRLASEELARVDLATAGAADQLASAPALTGELSTVALMAHLEDRRGRYGRSLELARSAPLSNTESARRRYDQVSREERQSALATLASAADIRRPLLAEWAAKGGNK